MSTKTIARLYLRRERDIIYLSSIFVETKDASIYISTPVGEEYKKLGMNNVKSSYHPDGQSHLTSQITNLKNIDDNTKRKTAKGLGFKGDKVYASSLKAQPLSEIDDIVQIGQGASFKDINNLSHGFYKVVNYEDIKWGSIIIDSKRYKDLSLNYFLIPKDKLSDAAGHVEDDYYVFPHPTMELSIVVHIFDFWQDSGG